MGEKCVFPLEFLLMDFLSPPLLNRYSTYTAFNFSRRMANGVTRFISGSHVHARNPILKISFPFQCPCYFFVSLYDYFCTYVSYVLKNDSLRIKMILTSHYFYLRRKFKWTKEKNCIAVGGLVWIGVLLKCLVSSTSFVCRDFSFLPACLFPSLYLQCWNIWHAKIVFHAMYIHAYCIYAYV